MSDLDSTDPTFVSDLLASDVAVQAVAAWLRDKKGVPAVANPIRVRPSPDERSEYADEGDITVGDLRVEVKHRKDIHFQSLEEFPYEWPMVDVVHSWEKAEPKPFCYFICNADLTGAIRIGGNTHRFWREEWRMDRHAGRERLFYECPKCVCSYVSFSDV